MVFEFKITLEVERTQGKFASREEIAECAIEQLEGAEPYIGGIGADGETEYDVTLFEVEEIIEKRTRQ
jgi:hypothetical protein